MHRTSAHRSEQKNRRRAWFSKSFQRCVYMSVGLLSIDSIYVWQTGSLWICQVHFAYDVFEVYILRLCKIAEISCSLAGSQLLPVTADKLVY